MQSIEEFLQKRLLQSESMALMIPRYLENPDRFIGKKQYTLQQVESFKEDAKKCQAILTFLRAYNHDNKRSKRID